MSLTLKDLAAITAILSGIIVPLFTFLGWVLQLFLTRMIGTQLDSYVTKADLAPLIREVELGRKRYHDETVTELSILTSKTDVANAKIESLEYRVGNLEKKP